MSIMLKDNVHWVGVTDWSLRKFHGEEYSTHRGSTYNSYLVQDEKTALIDTAWGPFARQYVENLARTVDLDRIDFVVANHGEPDHSGALPELMRHIPNRPVYCTANAVKSLKGQYHADWNFQVVKTGDRLSLGSRELIFIEAPMLHWPDTMFCYLTGSSILFSNDAFGQHLASETMYNDLVDQCELWQEAIKYYANILTPFSRLVEKKIMDFAALSLPLDMICPSHGVVWRDNPMQVVAQYLEWAKDYQENQVTVVYDSMWGATRAMADALAQTLAAEVPGLAVKVFNIAKQDKNDVITEVFKSKVLLLGSSTINRGILSAVAAFLEEMRGLGFKNKKAAAFGSYGWSGEGLRQISEGLKGAGFEVLSEGVRELWKPDAAGLDRCREFARSLVPAL